MRFVADNTVGRLRRWMSLLGYDIVYAPRSAREILKDWRDPICRERRAVLGRCPSLAGLEALAVFHVFTHIESPVLAEQLRQVAALFPLDFRTTLFSRCGGCNVTLGEPVDPESLRDEAPPLVLKHGRDFRRCPACQKLYWRGSHTENIERFLKQKVGLEWR
jgi:uncharacterized protein with PIN domain